MQGKLYSHFMDKDGVKRVERQILKESVFEPTQN